MHQRFSTNTFPSWRLAQPFRLIAHNGEINTVRGNVNWMNARRRTMESDLLGADLDKLWPIVPHGQSDTACLDNALELLLLGGYSLAHAMMMLVPEAWSRDPNMDPERRAFYEYHAALMEPWDGPAALASHRWSPDRRHARPQRPAPRTLLPDQGRYRLPRFGKRRAAVRRGRHRAQVAPAAGPHAAGSTSRKAASSRMKS